MRSRALTHFRKISPSTSYALPATPYAVRVGSTGKVYLRLLVSARALLNSQRDTSINHHVRLQDIQQRHARLKSFLTTHFSSYFTRKQSERPPLHIFIVELTRPPNSEQTGKDINTINTFHVFASAAFSSGERKPAGGGRSGAPSIQG